MSHPSNVEEARGQRSNESGYLQDLLAKGVPYGKAKEMDAVRLANGGKVPAEEASLVPAVVEPVPPTEPVLELPLAPTGEPIVKETEEDA